MKNSRQLEEHKPKKHTKSIINVKVLVYFVVIFIPSSGFYYVFYFKKLVATT
jgi:hypothetical protein